VIEAAAAHVAVIVGTLAALGACVLLQYEGLILIWRWLSEHTGHRRVNVLYGIFSVIVLHLLQIGIFGVTLWLLTLWPACGQLAGQESTVFADYLYFAAVTFSTVGFGEIWPVGAIRFLAATEALTGFVLIAWSASFTFFEMEKFWRIDDMDENK
jgi:hypothetical protein